LGFPPLLPASRARCPDVPRLIPRNSFQLTTSTSCFHFRS
jgi:hypothetical protein